jgi:E3 ubiquitin-protein ligase HERC1
LEGGITNLLIPTPNATNKCGFNTDRFVFNPQATVAANYDHLRFLGILLGVAMRTKKPLDLHLAQPMWKLLAGMNLTPDDLEEVNRLVHTS